MAKYFNALFVFSLLIMVMNIMIFKPANAVKFKHCYNTPLTCNGELNGICPIGCECVDIPIYEDRVCGYYE